MNPDALAAPFKQLIERKLWPVALLLVAALVAVPMLLGKSSDDADTGPVPAAVTLPPAQDASVVKLADANETDRDRAVLGARKDPFRPAQIHRVPKADTSASAQPGEATKADTGGGGGEAPASTDTPSTGGTDVPAVATPAPVEKPTYALYSLKVRFGSTDGDLRTRQVKRLTGLPGGTNPAALYLGLLRDHKTAVFIVDAGVEVLGDGHCQPSPEDCQTLTLKKGETEFLTRGDKQWELDLVDVHTAKTTDERAARRSRTAVAADGRRALRRLRPRAGAFDYDAAAGSLERVGRTARSERLVAPFSTSG